MAKRRAHCASAKLASAASGVYVYVYAYDRVYISHMVDCHTEYMNVCLWVCVCEGACV